MTLRLSSPDNYASNRDNLSWTVSQFADRRQIQKNILSPDSFSLRSTVAPALIAFIKTIYNKVAGQSLSRLFVVQPLTSLQNISRQILHSGLLAHGAQAEFCLYSFVCAKSKHPPLTSCKIFQNHSAPIFILILTIIFSFNCLAQIKQPQTPQFGNYQQTTQTQNHSANNMMGATDIDIMEQSYQTAEKMMGTYMNRPYLTQEQNQKAMQAYLIQKSQPGYDKPSEENNFRQTNPQMTMEKEMNDLFNEAHYMNSVVKSNAYYNSPEYLNDLPNYLKAKNTLKKMINGEMPISIKDAYYIAESAYGNLYLSYEEYNKIIDDDTKFTKQWLKENGYNPNDAEAKHYGVQKLLSDTLCINENPDINTSGKKCHYPVHYDYIDYSAKEDRRNYFITKTLATGTGQCHTLPVDYLIHAEALGAPVNMAYNPQHSFIRYKNNNGTILNYETTVDRFLPDAFYTETLPVMAKAQKNKIFVNSLSKKQIVATILLDLAASFEREHWLADRKFISECMDIASTCFPNKNYINTTSNYLNKRLFAAAFNDSIEAKGIKDLKEIEKYPDLIAMYDNFRLYLEKVSALGIQDFPESEYIRLMKYYDVKGKLQIQNNPDAKSKKNLYFNK